ncbi:hypothetical protein BOW53_13355 [Solemya pervernicosa gill symbiont]|uniref:Rhodanese domain-containing protein n=1 Tax=Solemya pervernicosa gill symbiont TaxID=642797 RepID=A0A1T2L1Q3_9GAMM|nr:hypothetical protein BOW53_13355 [Solemya pervernicosa gill symbiont]
MLAFSPFATSAGSSPETIDGAVTVDTAAAKALFDDNVPFVDVRSAKAYGKGHIAKAHNLDVKSFKKNDLASVAGKDAPVVFYCDGVFCKRAAGASKKAVGWGWSNVKYYREGFPGWKGAGHPVE